MEFKDELKSTIIEAGWTITKVVEEMNRLNGTYTSVQNFSSKMIRETFKYTEVQQILSIIGYKIEWKATSNNYIINTVSQYNWKTPVEDTSNDNIVKDVKNRYNKIRDEYIMAQSTEMNHVSEASSEYILKNELEKYIDKSLQEAMKTLVKIAVNSSKKKED